jgi:hypothetical protein
MKTNSFKKISMASVAIVIALLASVMTGCQKEMEDEMRSQIKVEKITSSYNPIRLKSDNENGGDNEILTLVASYTISSSNPTQYVSLSGNRTYKLYFQSAEIYATAEIKMITGPGPEGTVNMSHTTTNNSTPDVYLLTPAAAGGSFTLQRESGASAIVQIYRCD